MKIRNFSLLIAVVLGIVANASTASATQPPVDSGAAGVVDAERARSDDYDPEATEAPLEPMDNPYGCNPGVLQCGNLCCNAYPHGVCCSSGACAPDESFCSTAKSGCSLDRRPGSTTGLPALLWAALALAVALRRRVAKPKRSASQPGGAGAIRSGEGLRATAHL